MIEVRTFVAGIFSQNTYLVWRPDSREAVAIDAGAGVAQMIETLEENELRLSAVLLTHAHIDHVEGLAHLRRHVHAPIYLHTDDRIFYDNIAAQGAHFGVRVETPPAVDQSFDHDTKLGLAGLEFTVKHVPGHAPGHVSLFLEAASTAFVGDVVFQGSIGRTDLPGGDYQRLMRSIRDHVMTLPDETVLYTGHGPATTVQAERRTNPFIAPMYGGSFA